MVLDDQSVLGLEIMGGPIQRTRRQHEELHPEDGGPRLHSSSPEHRPRLQWAAADPDQFRRELRSVTHVTSDSVIPVTRARVTPISRYPVTCVTEGGRKDLVRSNNAITPNSQGGAR